MQLLAAGVNNLAGEAATAAAEAGAAEADAGSTTEAHPRTTAAAAIRAVTAVAREILRLIHDPFESMTPSSIRIPRAGAAPVRALAGPRGSGSTYGRRAAV